VTGGSRSAVAGLTGGPGTALTGTALTGTALTGTAGSARPNVSSRPGTGPPRRPRPAELTAGGRPTELTAGRNSATRTTCVGTTLRPSPIGTALRRPTVGTALRRPPVRRLRATPAGPGGNRRITETTGLLRPAPPPAPVGHRLLRGPPGGRPPATPGRDRNRRRVSGVHRTRRGMAGVHRHRGRCGRGRCGRAVHGHAATALVRHRVVHGDGPVPGRFVPGRLRRGGGSACFGARFLVP
jgi:hypothetical protein